MWQTKSVSAGYKVFLLFYDSMSAERSQTANCLPAYSREYRDFTGGFPVNQKLRFMQWNVLAQGFIPLDEFIHCSSSLLELDRRCDQVVQEILHFRPDVICLQEADFIHHLVKRLETNGLSYCFQFSPKVYSACLGIPGNIGPDGSAIIYRSDRLELMQSRELPLDEFADRSALFCEFRLILEPVSSSSTFYVTSAHLKAKPQCFNIRLEQGRCLLKSLDQLAHEKRVRCPPLFICGDFNAEPHESVIKMLLGAFSQNSPEWSLHSAYSEANLGEEPEFTTWKIRESKRLSKRTEVCHTIDYILYSSKSVQLLGVWWIPDRHLIGLHGLPSSRFPSDHLNLVADFELRRAGIGDG
ncbi:hypothetical protein AHF37_03182 [Paragonimus kellicotti]|nr:hypothetical protein AHF37_03182 [Paragonimus kellicotti]